jgi:hypothetical protein
MVPQLNSFLDKALTKSSRSPLDLVAYQHLIWILDAEEASEKTGQELSALVHSMWLAFYTRSWKNTYNPSGKLSRVGTLEKVQVKLQKKKKKGGGGGGGGGGGFFFK